MLEDAADDSRVGDDGDEVAAAFAARAGEDVDGKDATQQLCPGEALARCGRRGRGTSPEATLWRVPGRLNQVQGPTRPRRADPRAQLAPHSESLDSDDPRVTQTGPHDPARDTSRGRRTLTLE